MRPVTLALGAGDLLRVQHAERRGGRAGHPHERARRHGVQPAPAPDRGGARGGVDHQVAESDGTGQLQRLRSPGQHRLRAQVGRDPGDRPTAELAAGSVGPVEQHHLQGRVGLDQVPGGSQPADAAADDAHALYLPWPQPVSARPGTGAAGGLTGSR